MRRRVTLIFAALFLLAAPFLMAPASPRSYVAGNFMLELDGVQQGYVKAIAGGNVYAEVINEPTGPDYFVHKHIGQPKYEDFEAQIGLSMGKSVYEWISASWKQNYQRKNGAVTAMDLNLRGTSQRQFYNALLTETTIPAMDASSKEPGYLTIKFQPEYTRNTKAPENKGTSSAATPRAEQKTWLPSNFKLEIAGLDCTRVNKIDAFTVKQKAVQDAIGDARDQQREPGKIEFPNLKITLPVAYADAWLAWHEDFVLKGNNGQDKEKNGTLTLLATDRQTVLATVKLFNMGIISVKDAGAEANQEQIARYEVELYVERMELEVPSGLK